MKRDKIINEILYFSGDEFENNFDLITLAKENKKQLVERLEYIKTYKK